MSYGVNHKRHIAEYFENHPLATGAELARALPRSKRTRCSMSTMLWTLKAMSAPTCRTGVVRVAHGLYAWWNNPPLRLQVAAHGDKLATALLKEMSIYPTHKAWTKRTLLEISSRAGFHDKAVVEQKLRQLKKKGVVHGRAEIWGLTMAAMEYAFPYIDPHPTPSEPTTQSQPEIDIFS